MARTAKVVNTSRRVVLDGGGRVTLSGGGERRILYQNTCDPQQTWTTSHCDDQARPRLVVQNMTFADGDATGETYDGGGGGAIFARGGRLKIVGSTFLRNRCDPTGPRPGRRRRPRPVAAPRPARVRPPQHVQARRLQQRRRPEQHRRLVVGLRQRLRAQPRHRPRGQPPKGGAPGGGSGGAIYTDGNAFRVLLARTRMHRNHAREGGGAVFFVSNDRTGTLEIRSSTLRRNPSDEFETDPGIFFLGRSQTVVDSVVE